MGDDLESFTVSKGTEKKVETEQKTTKKKLIDLGEKKEKKEKNKTKRTSESKLYDTVAGMNKTRSTTNKSEEKKHKAEPKEKTTKNPKGAGRKKGSTNESFDLIADLLNEAVFQPTVSMVGISADDVGRHIITKKEKDILERVRPSSKIIEKESWWTYSILLLLFAAIKGLNCFIALKKFQTEKESKTTKEAEHE